jgi:hypothetical protein
MNNYLLLIFVLTTLVFSSCKRKMRENISIKLLNPQQHNIFLELFVINPSGKKVSTIKSLSSQNQKIRWEGTSHRNQIFFKSGRVWIDKNKNYHEEKEEISFCDLNSSIKKSEIDNKNHLIFLNCKNITVILHCKKYHTKNI